MTYQIHLANTRYIFQARRVQSKLLIKKKSGAVSTKVPAMSLIYITRKIQRPQEYIEAQNT